jgi:hypothetical protein
VPVSAEEFSRFMDGLSAITPAVGDALEADGEPRSPDMETPVLWMSSVGHAVAATLPTLSPEAQRAVLGVVERGMTSGGELLRTALATGLLEALAHDMDRAVVSRELVAPLLGRRSRAYLDAWDDFTLGESTSGTS